MRTPGRRGRARSPAAKGGKPAAPSRGGCYPAWRARRADRRSRERCNQDRTAPSEEDFADQDRCGFAVSISSRPWTWNSPLLSSRPRPSGPHAVPRSQSAAGRPPHGRGREQRTRKGNTGHAACRWRRCETVRDRRKRFRKCRTNAEGKRPGVAGRPTCVATIIRCVMRGEIGLADRLPTNRRRQLLSAREWLCRDLPQARHRAEIRKTENLGFMRVTSEGPCGTKNGPEGPFLFIVFSQVIDLEVVGATGFEPAASCSRSNFKCW